MHVIESRNKNKTLSEPDSFRKEAEEHWQFIDELLKTIEDDSGMVPYETLRYLYIEAMIHGYKHAKESEK
jgi:hypothetical protein